MTKKVDENHATDNEIDNTEPLSPAEPKLTVVNIGDGMPEANPTRGADADDPFDPKKIRLEHNYAETLNAVKAVMTVRARRPEKHFFFRVHPSPEFTVDTYILDMKDDGEVYLVSPEMAAAFPGDVVAKRIFTTVTRQNDIHLWPVRLPGEDGKLDPWNRSALEIADVAKKEWVRVVSNQRIGAYEAYSAVVPPPEPVWPAHSFADLLRAAFSGKKIDNPAHPVVRRLRGEI